MKKIILFATLFILPVVVSANHIAGHVVNPAVLTPLGGRIIAIFNILYLVLPIIGALALIWFFWGIIQYVLKADNEEKQTEARSYMIYAVIGMFVMFSIWGLVHLVQYTFFRPNDPCLRLNAGEIPTVPVLPVTGATTPTPINTGNPCL